MLSVLVRRRRARRKRTNRGESTQRKEWLPFLEWSVRGGGSYTYKKRAVWSEIMMFVRISIIEPF